MKSMIETCYYFCIRVDVNVHRSKKRCFSGKRLYAEGRLYVSGAIFPARLVETFGQLARKSRGRKRRALCTFACTVCRWPSTRVSPPLFGQRDNIVKLFVVPLDERDSRTARVNSISETIRFIFPRVWNVQCEPRCIYVWSLSVICGRCPSRVWTCNTRFQASDDASRCVL